MKQLTFSVELTSIDLTDGYQQIVYNAIINNLKPIQLPVIRNKWCIKLKLNVNI